MILDSSVSKAATAIIEAAISAAVISAAVTPSTTVADLDGTAAAGVSADYARGDHKHDDVNRPTNDEKAALAGTDGTPSAINKFVTDSDPRHLGGPTSGYWSPLTNGDPINPELVYLLGDVIAVWTSA